MFKNLFKSKKILELTEKKEKLMSEIEKLSNELRKKDALLKCKNDLINKKEAFSKQENVKENWQEMEEALKNAHKENLELRKILQEKNSFFDLSFLKTIYLIPLEKMFPEVRFKKVIETLDMNVQDLSLDYLNSLEISEKLKNEITERVERFHNGEMSWEVKTFLIKGERLSKLYHKYRKLLNIFNEKYFEFISDLEGFDFDSLEKSGYSKEEIASFKEIYITYREKYKREVI